MPVSNTYGRAFEYIICKRLEKNIPNFSFTKRAINEQEKDKLLYNGLPENIKNTYKNSAKQISKWILSQFESIQNSTNVSIDRLPDSEGVKGDVTDIRITTESEVINISLKHNHNALKHPRLSKVPQWINVSDTYALSNYKQAYNTIWENIIQDAKRNVPGITLFSELNTISDSYINQRIYHPLCELVAQFLISNIINSDQVSNMFYFLVGNCNFIKIIDYPKEIVISNFVDIPTPNKVVITHTQDSYLKMEFDNNWILNLRLHTASSRLITKSIKFDVRAEKTTVSEYIISK